MHMRIFNVQVHFVALLSLQLVPSCHDNKKKCHTVERT